MKLYFIFFSCLFLTWSCKKKQSDPTPIQPDELIYKTSFQDITWATHSTSKSTSAYELETYNLSIDTINWFVYELAPDHELTSAYSIEVDVKIRLQDVSKLGFAGFIYNFINSENYSIMNICTNGTFSAYKVTEGVGTPLFYSTVSTNLIKGSGQSNHIKIKQRLNSQEFILNGVSQGEFPFQLATQSVQVGLTAVTYPDFYTSTKSTFDNFILKKIY